MSKPEKQTTGPHFIYLGAAFWVLALILLHWPGGSPQTINGFKVR